MSDTSLTQVPSLTTTYARISRHSKQSSSKTSYDALYGLYRPSEQRCSGDLPKDQLIAAYASFISSFTHENEVTFLCTETSDIDADVPHNRRLVTITFADDQGEEYTAHHASRTPLDVREAAIQDGELRRENMSNAFSFLIARGHPGASVDYSHFDKSDEQYGFYVIVENGRLCCKFNPTTIPEQMVPTIVDTLGSFMNSANGRPTTSLSALNHPPHQIPLKFPSEYNSRACDAAIDEQQYPALLHHAFVRRAQQYPNRIAVDFLSALPQNDQPAVHDTITYRGLDERSTLLAATLQSTLGSLDADHQSVVLCMIPPSIPFYTSWLGVLKAGLVFCPIAVDTPAARLQKIIETTGSKIVLTSQGCSEAETWRDTLGNLCRIDVEGIVSSPGSVQGANCSVYQPRPVQEDDVAYVMFTSGSTGQPKGVQITHLAASCSIASHVQYMPQSWSEAGFRWFQFISPTFDPSILEIFVTLSLGGTLCTSPRSVSLTDPEQTLDEVQAMIMVSTPSLASMIRPAQVPSLQYLWTMGEILNRRVIESFSSDSSESSIDRARGSPTALLNAYGPTEAAINCTAVPSVSACSRGSIIGKALPTCSLFIIEPQRRTPTLVPLGFPGELAIGGPQVSTGYLNDPEKTAEAFVHSEQFGRLYRTGDRARVVIDDKGEQVVEFLGRLLDRQVKLSGRRVELGETEYAISTVSGVRDIVAFAYSPHNAGSGGDQVAVCIVPSEEQQRETLLEQCKHSAEQALLPFMQPQHYLFFDSLPRSEAGKISRPWLQELRLTLSTQTSNCASSMPQSTGNGNVAQDSVTIPQDLRHALSDVLYGSDERTIDSIPPAASLLSLGIDSLGAVRLLQRLRERGVTGITATDVLRLGTVAALSELVTSLLDASAKPAVGDGTSHCQTTTRERIKTFCTSHAELCSNSLGVSQDAILKILPATPTQAGMLANFLRTSTEKSTKRSYVHHSVYHVTNKHDFDRLETSWRTVLRESEMYRTVFVSVDDDLSPFAQVVLCAELQNQSDHVYRTTCEEREVESRIHAATVDAEKCITLQSPPWRLVFIRAGQQLAIVFSQSHGVFDGGSLEILLCDIQAEYEGRSRLAQIPPDAAVLRHFASDLDAAGHYWQRKMANVSLSRFPIVTPHRPELASSEPFAAEITSQISRHSLRDGAKKLGCSPLSVLQAAWSTILMSYSSSSEISFGSVLSDRLDGETVRCLAPTFVVLPTCVSAIGSEQSQSVAAILEYLSHSSADNALHPHVDMASLRNSVGEATFDTLFAYQDFAEAIDSEPFWEAAEYPPMENEFAVMIEIWPAADANLRLRATCHEEHLDLASACMMLQQFDDIVAWLLQNPDAAFKDARHAARSQCLALSPATGNPRPDDSSNERLLHHLFSQNLAHWPGRCALQFKPTLGAFDQDTAWSYAELNEKANLLSEELLQKFGSLSKTVVPLIMPKSPSLFLAVLAVLKLGAAWCSIDQSFPVARKRGLIERTGSRLVLVADEQDTNMVPDDVLIIDVRSLTLVPRQKDLGSKTSPVDPECDIVEDDIAYMIFTSGTTGPPKGVPISHKSAVAAMQALADAIPSDVNGSEAPRVLQFSQNTFDVFVQDLFYTWAVGGTVVAAPRELTLSQPAELVHACKATHAHLTPAFAGTMQRSDFPTLEVVTMIGEKLPQAVSGDWGRNMRAYNTYGPAECTVVATLRRFGAEEDHHPASNVGVPLPTVGAYVLDAGKPVLRGAAGELVLSGIQLSPGYYKDAAMTDKKFVYNQALDQMVYHTGDVVRSRVDGTIDFVGRDDDLIKLNGVRMELSEIAFAVQKSDSLLDRVVVLHCARSESASQDKVLVAFATCAQLEGGSDEPLHIIDNKAAADITGSALRKTRNLLPEYMMPSNLLIVSKIPHSASNKVDRHSLQALLYKHEFTTDVVNNDTDGGGDHLRDWLREHQPILDAVAQLTGVNARKFHPTLSLRSLALDSLRMIRLVTRLKDAGTAARLPDIMQCQNLSELVAAVISHHSARQPSTSFGSSTLHQFNNEWHRHVEQYIAKQCFEAATQFLVAPALISQEGILSETLRSPNAYWANHLYDLRSDTDLERLRHAWSKVAAGTDALRTGFVVRASLETGEDLPASSDLTFLQIVYNKSTIDWMELEVSDMSPATVEGHVDQIYSKHRDSDYVRPLWAVTIFHHGKDSSMLVTVHHSVFDGPSLDMLMQDLRCQYGGTLMPRPRAQLQTATEQMPIRAINPELHTATYSFWREQLSNFVMETSDEDETRSDQRENRITHRTITSNLKTTHSDLRTRATALGGSSASAIIRVAWGLLLCDKLERENLLLAEIISERVLREGLDTAIGPLVSTVPVPISSVGSARQIFEKQDALFRNISSFSSVSPRAIKQILGLTGSAGSLYPAVYSFHFEGFGVGAADYGAWSEAPAILDLAVEHPFALNVFQEADRLVLELSVDTALMTATEQGQLMQQLQSTVDVISLHPNKQIESITKHFPSELLSFTPFVKNPTYPVNVPPTYWIERWAAGYPSWNAVQISNTICETFDDSLSWTYGELNARADKIAQFLAKKNIQRRTVAMCLGRTLWSFAVVLGILKSGNVYLPIEENFPADRKAFLLEDSNAALVFTECGLFDGVVQPPGCAVCEVNEDFTHRIEAMEQPGVLSVNAKPKDGAYILYTSGSTGKPKGVLVSRANLSSFMEAYSELICGAAPATIDLAGKGGYLCLASRAFDVHIGEMFLAWRHGMCAVSASRTALLDDLALALRMLKITHASFVPSLLDQTGLTPDDAPDLVLLFVGGEKMSEKNKKIWGASDRVSLINTYGPTEVTIGCNCGQVFADTDTSNIGKPLGDSRAHILKPGSDQYVLRGTSGELCYTGSLVALGYLNRPDATGFVEEFHGERMYRTGDIVRMLPDGTIQFIGRKDDQVKIRGQRVELGEVSEGVRVASSTPIDVSTLVLKHPSLPRSQLVAFVAESASSRGAKNAPASILATRIADVNDSLKGACRAFLAAYMVPDLIVPITYIPLAVTSGKADNKLLKKIFNETPAGTLSGRPGVLTNAPASDRARDLTDDEKQISKIVQGAVSASEGNFRPHASLFELGVDSLSAISIFSQMRACGHECSVAMLMRNPTIEELARLPKRVTPANDVAGNGLNASAEQRGTRLLDDMLASGCLQVSADQVEDILPAMPLQETLITSTLNGAAGGYINSMLLSFDGNIRLARLRSSLARVVADNPILRTCFQLHNDRIYQVHLKPRGTDSYYTESSSDGDVTVEQQHTRLANAASLEIVDTISRNAPFLFQVWTKDNRLYATLTMHHALYDANSLQMLQQDLRAAYDDKTSDGRPDPRLMLEYVTNQDVAGAQAFYSEALAGWEKTYLLGDGTDSLLEEIGKVSDVKLSDVDSLASRLKVTVTSLLQSIFALAMAQAQGTPHLIYGAVLSGRTVPVDGASDMMLPCITTVPMRVDLSRHRGAKLEALIAQVQEINSRTLEYQHISPRSIQRWTGASRPLYDCLFSYMKLDATSTDQALWTTVENSIRVDYNFAVEFEANAANDTLKIGLGFTRAFGDKRKADAFIRRMETLLGTLIKGETHAIADFGPNDNLAGDQSRDLDSTDNSWSMEEAQLRDTIAEFCPVDANDITKSTSFIQLGVDSIVAIRFARHLRSRGVNVSSADVIRHGSIRELLLHKHSSSSAHVNGTKTTDKTAGIISALKGAVQECNIDNVERCYEVTPLQGGMLTQSVASDGMLYVHSHPVIMREHVDQDTIQRACSDLVRRNDILRTSFRRMRSKGCWVAIVRNNAPSALDVCDSHDFQQSLREIISRVSFAREEDFDEPPIRFHLVRSPDAWLLSITLHHALYDGMSVPLLFSQLAADLRRNTQSVTVPFYRAAELINERQNASVEYWTSKLKGYRSNVGAENWTTALTYRTLQCTQSLSLLEDFCRQNRITIQSLCLLAFAKALAHRHGQRDVVFGQVVAGRNLPLEGADTVCGPLFNTVPTRIQIVDDEETTNGSALRSVQTKVNESIDYHHASLAVVQKQWHQANSSNDSSLFDSLFTFQKAPHATDGAGPNLFEPYDLGDRVIPSEYRLNFEAEQTESELVLRCAARMEQPELDTFFEHFTSAFEDILNNPSRAVTRVPEGLTGLPLSALAETKPLSSFDSDATERFSSVLRKAMAEVCQIPESAIDLDTSIFSVGLDSIAAIQVAQQVRREGHKISAADIIQGVKLGRICELLMDRAAQLPVQKRSAGSVPDINDTLSVRSSAASKILKLREEEVEDVAPCLPGQEHHLFEWLRSGRTFYEPAWTYVATSQIEEGRLEKAWRDLKKRHTILRTTFAATSATSITQVVLKSDAGAAPRFEIVHCEDRDLDDAMRDRVRLESASPSDLFEAPIRLRLVRAKDRDGIAIILMHALYDAFSMTRLVAELVDLYKGISLGAATPFAEHVRNSLSQLRHRDQCSFWKQALSGNSATMIPMSSNAAPTDEGAHQRSTFTLLHGAALDINNADSQCRAAAISLHHLVLAAYARVLARHAKVQNPLFGFFQHGRSDNEADSSVAGPCVNLLPVGVKNALDVTPPELARRLQTDLSERVPYEQSRLSAVLQWAGLKTDNDNGRVPFNTHINLLFRRDLFDKAPSEQESSQDLLSPLRLGVPSDYAPERAIPGRTAIDALLPTLQDPKSSKGEVAVMQDCNLYLDVAPRDDMSGLDFGVRCEGTLIGMDGEATLDENLQTWLRGIDREIITCLEAVVEENLPCADFERGASS